MIVYQAGTSPEMINQFNFLHIFNLGTAQCNRTVFMYRTKSLLL